MVTMLRRLFWMALLGGGGFAAWSVWQRRHEADTPPAPEWPPLRPTTATASARSTEDRAGDRAVADAPHPVTPGPGPAATADPAPVEPVTPVATAATWVAPVDGACPEGYPVKANDNSGIYHVPGGRFYERTVPERCYARTDDAEADGYRAAKA
jgi:hypothetical protein